MRSRVIIGPDEDGTLVVEVPGLPGCISQGRTRAGSVENIKEAIAAYLGSLQAHSEPIPPPIRAGCRAVPIRRGVHRAARGLMKGY